MISYHCVCIVLIVLTVGRKSASGADAGHNAGIQGLYSAINEENDSDNESMRDQVWKIIANRDSKSSGMHLEGEEGTELVVHEGALVDNEAQRAKSSQNAMGPSSTNVVANMGTQVLRPRYFLLLEIDGFLMW